MIYISSKYPQMYQHKNIQFKADDMAAFLMYRINQSKHIDTQFLMNLTDPNPANSSLYMINAPVNAYAEIEVLEDWLLLIIGEL